MARRSRSGGGKLMSQPIILIVGALAVGLAVFGIYKGHKNQQRASSAYYMPLSHPNVRTLGPARWDSPFAGQLSGETLGGQQEIGPASKVLQNIARNAISSDLRYTLSRFSDSEGYTSGTGGGTTVSSLGAGKRLAMHGDSSYQGEKNTPIFHPPSLPPSIKVQRVIIAGAPSRGNDYIGGVAIGYRDRPRY